MTTPTTEQVTAWLTEHRWRGRIMAFGGGYTWGIGDVLAAREAVAGSATPPRRTTMADNEEPTLDEVWPVSRNLYNQVVAEREALRAALAAQSQPLLDGWLIRYGSNGVDRWIEVWTEADVLADPAIRQGQRVVVYRAVAGSATPTECCDDCCDRDHAHDVAPNDHAHGGDDG